MAASSAPQLYSKGGLPRNFLELTIHEANKLPSVDRNGLCDPIVFIRDVKGMIGEDQVTALLKKTLHPVWNQSFNLAFNMQGRKIRLIVKDHDRRKSKKTGQVKNVYETLGEVEVPLYMFTSEDGSMKTFTLPLHGGASSKARYPPTITISGRMTWNMPVYERKVWVPVNADAVTIGLGWDEKKGQSVDLDAGVMAFHSSGDLADTCYYRKKNVLGGAVCSLGDNQTGKGDGDDERIIVNLAQLSQTFPDVNRLVVTVNNYKRGSLREATDTSYVRVIEGASTGSLRKKQSSSLIEELATDGRTMGCYDIDADATPNKQGIFFGYFLRHHETGAWWFCVVAEGVDGNECAKSLGDCTKIFGKLALP